MPITVVQTATPSTGSGSSLTCSFPLNVTIGNGLVVLAGSSGLVTVNTVTDTLGNTYFKRMEQGQASAFVIDAFDCLAGGGGGASTITATFSGSGTCFLSAAEVLGSLTHNTHNQTGSNLATQTCGSITTTVAETIVFIVDRSATGITAPPAGFFPVDFLTAGTQGFASAYNVYSAVQTGLNPAFTASGSGNYAGGTVAYTSNNTHPPGADFVIPAVRFGPPIPGSPWMMSRPYRPPPPVKAPPAPPPDTVRTYTRPTYGPPVPGSPWTAKFGFPQSVGKAPPPTPPPVGPQPPPLTASQRAAELDLVERVPENRPADTRRLSRALDKISVRLNALARKGQLVRDGNEDWSLRSGAHAAARAPTAADDVSAGFTAGNAWLDTSAKKIYFCAVNTKGAAVWLGPFG